MRDVAGAARLLPLVVAVLLLGVPSGAAGTGSVYAEGHIDAAAFGGPILWQALLGHSGALSVGEPLEEPVSPPWAFESSIDIPAGAWVTTTIDDHGGAGYFVGFYFLDDERHHVETTCTSGQGNGLLTEEPASIQITDMCRVPTGAVTIFMYAHHGAGLDVRLVDAPAPA